MTVDAKRLEEVWEQHLAAELDTKDVAATLAAMVDSGSDRADDGPALRRVDFVARTGRAASRWRRSHRHSPTGSPVY
jgi:hypothetical protein